MQADGVGRPQAGRRHIGIKPHVSGEAQARGLNHKAGIHSVLMGIAQGSAQHMRTAQSCVPPCQQLLPSSELSLQPF